MKNRILIYAMTVIGIAAATAGPVFAGGSGGDFGIFQSLKPGKFIFDLIFRS